MKASTRFVIGGAVLGAILGAFGGLLYASRSEGRGSKLMEIDTSKLFHLGTSAIAVLRQIIELS